jgi:cell division protein ZapA (FtsZ GTPase activity inhibitor)
VKTHEITIGGHQLRLRSPADPEYVQALAELVDERVQMVASQGAGPVGTILLAALGLADELEKAKGEAARLKRDVKWRAGDLLTTLDELKRPRTPPERG